MSIKGMCQRYPGRTIVVLGLCLIGEGASAWRSYLLIDMMNTLISNQWQTFAFFGLMMIAIGIIGHLFLNLGSYQYDRLSQNYVEQLRQESVNYYANNDRDVATMQGRLSTDFQLLLDNYFKPVFQVVDAIIAMVFSLAILVSFHWSLVLLVIVLSVLMLIVPQLFSAPYQKAIVRISEQNQHYLDVVKNWLGGIKEIKQYHALPHLNQQLQEGAASLKDAYLKQSWIQVWISAIVFGMNIISQVLVMLLCGWLVFVGTLSAGVLFAVGNFASTIFNGLVTVAETLSQVQSNKQLLETIDVELVSEVSLLPAEKQPFDHLTVRGVTYTYPNGATVTLPDLTVAAHEKVLLAGDSGAGKSTLIKLLHGDYQPTTGAVTFYTEGDQVVPLEAMSMAYLPQDPVLFPGTITENMTMFNANQVELVSDLVPQLALSADIQKMAQGLDTVITLDPLNVSGGQRQKIVLGRATLTKQEVLLMDESTSAIDQAGSEQMMANLLASDQTVICIAHHMTPELIERFDRVVTFTKS
ncbi:MAG: ABC transporter ATP-binding protein [Aerococcus sp.]|nr:ABC transporter ATP-binding protein [Aerococcus sp.]